MSRIPVRGLVTLCFVVSGATGLTYQVIWVRLLTQLAGHSSLAVAAVVSVFMAGLGLGARLVVGRVGRRPLVTYGLLEAAIGGWALLSPHLVRWLTPLFAPFALADASGLATFAVAVAVLLVPTVMMGATLPVLVHWYARDAETLGRDTGWLYAMNTVGAVLGALLCGFWLLPTLGQPQTLLLAASGNGVVALLALVLGRVVPRAPARSELPASAVVARPAQKVVLAAFAISGAAALANEVAWTRAFELFAGSTTFAFSLIAAAFIAGLALGGHVSGPVADRIVDRVRALAWLNLGIAGAAAAVRSVVGELPLWLIDPVARHMDSFVETEALVAVVVFSLVAVPTALMGATWPMTMRALVDRPEEASERVGRAMAWNTAGAVVGAAAAALLAIPLLGLQGTLTAAIVLNLCAAALLLGRPAAWLLPTLAAGALALSPPWNPRHMNLAPWIYARDLQDPAVLRESLDSVVLFHEEGRGATVTTFARPSGARTLRINGKTDASSIEDRLTQGMLGHLGLLLARERKDVLVIGLGSGMSVAAALAHPLEHLRVVELLPEVARSQASFVPVTGPVMDDPRVELVLGDALPQLRYGSETWDVIISQPTNLFVSGVSTLFTREAFAAMRGRLRPGGTVVVWIQGYLLRAEDLRTVLTTFLDVFPHSSLWTATPHDLLLIASDTPLDLDAEVLDHRIRETADSTAGRWTGLAAVEDLQRHFQVGEQGLRSMALGGALHHDRDPFLEYSAPRALFESSASLDDLPPREPLPLNGASPHTLAALDDRYQAARHLDPIFRGRQLAPMDAEWWRDEDHPTVHQMMGELRFGQASALARQGKLDLARLAAAESTGFFPDNFNTWRLRAGIEEALGGAPLELYEQAALLQADNPYAHWTLADALDAEGRPAEAARARATGDRIAGR